MDHHNLCLQIDQFIIHMPTFELQKKQCESFSFSKIMPMLFCVTRPKCRVAR